MLAVKSLAGSVKINSVDEGIFKQRCFSDCLKFEACHDICCSHGCDVDRAEAQHILELRDELEPLIKIPAGRWFEKKWTPDADFPSGEFTRSRVYRGKCIFYAHELRGCTLHRFAVTKGMDPHRIKPMVCFLFPITWENGKLFAGDFLFELPCAAQGVTLFEAQKAEIGSYFGGEFTSELEGLIPKI